MEYSNPKGVSTEKDDHPEQLLELSVEQFESTRSRLAEIEDTSIEMSGWMTIGAMAAQLGKSHDWVKARIQKKYSTDGQYCPDNVGRIRLYFPPEVFTALDDELDTLGKYPIVRPCDISLNGLSIAIGRGEKWIKARTPYLDIVGNTKLNPVNNRLFEYYQQEDLALLEREVARIDQYPRVEEGDATEFGLAKIMGHDQKWMRRRLAMIAAEPTVKLDVSKYCLGAYYPVEETTQKIIAAGHAVISPARVSHRPSLPVPVSIRVWDGSEVLVTHENWHEFADCSTTDPEVFSPEKRERETEAKGVCGGCEARLFCLDYAVATDQKHGIWGGKNRKERKALPKG